MSILNTFIILVLLFVTTTIFIYYDSTSTHGGHMKIIPRWASPFINKTVDEELHELFESYKDNIVEKDGKNPYHSAIRSGVPTTFSPVSHVQELDNSEKQTKVALPLNSTGDDDSHKFSDGVEELKGLLTCDGKNVESEIIYWKIVKGDRHYESPITPHHS